MVKPQATGRPLALLALLSIILSGAPTPPPAAAFSAAPAVVISQVYGGGGNGGATLRNDFIELFNRGASPVSLAGWSVQYASSSGDSWQKTDLSGTIQPGRYYLVQQGAGAGGSLDLPTPDATGGIALSATSGKVALVSGSSTLPDGTGCPSADPNVVDFAGYGVADCAEASPAPALSNTTAAIRAAGGCADTNNNLADFAAGAPNPRNSAAPASTCGAPPPPPEPTAATIAAIQGSGPAVTGAGPFIVEATVVGDYQAGAELRGFFIQEEDVDSDGNPATSEGIFVFCGACPTSVSVGDRVRVTGPAAEFFGMSQLTAGTVESVTVLSSGNPLPTPATPALPVPGITATNLSGARAQIDAFFEPFEGMLVRFTTQLAIAEYFELGRYGQIVLAAGGRPRQFTDQSAPSAAGYALHQVDLARRTIILDDLNNIENFVIDGGANRPSFWPRPGLSAVNRLRGGDTITNLTGVLHWSFAGEPGTDAWRVRPVEPTFSYAFTPANPRPPAPSVQGSLKVAAYNVLNYFLTIDTTASGSTGSCGASQTLDCRGPDSAAERDRQQAKLTQALLGIDADIVGLVELENTPGVTPTLEIVSDLNAVAGAGTYAYIDTGVVGTDAIRVGLIYKPARATPVGAPLVDTAAVHNRPPLAQQFQMPNGERVTVIVSHFKSKSCAGAAGANLDQGDGQGCFNADRVAQAQALLSFISARVLPAAGDLDVLVVGDLNSYRNEDPIAALEAAGLVDLIDARLGPGAYSYLFGGQLGYLDHALASASLAPQVAGVDEWHINADEPDLLDYNDTVRDIGEAFFERRSSAQELYAADAFRTSDHDPVVVGLNLTAAAAQRPVYLPLIGR